VCRARQPIRRLHDISANARLNFRISLFSAGASPSSEVFRRSGKERYPLQSWPQRMEVHMAISSQTVERCIEECLQCIRWCSQCREESLAQDPLMMRESIRLCSECLELCQACLALLTASSLFAHRVCGVCSELCAACATECGKHEGETMQRCAQACRRCAATCAEVAQAGPLRRAAAQT
jgi:hypothetical protein